MPLLRPTDPEALDEVRATHTLIDLHFHTRFSDGRATPRQAVDRARALGMRVAITDHNVVEGALEAWTLAGDDAPRLLVPGVEITTRERIHLLVYFRSPHDLHHFYEAHVAPYRPRGATATSLVDRGVADLLPALRRYDHLTSAAHPFALAKNGWMTAREQHRHIGPLLAELDAVEVCNGEELDGGNDATAALARDSGHGATAGSDGHTLGELGNVTLALPPGVDLFDAVLARATPLIDLRAPGAWRRLVSHAAKAPYFAKLPADYARRWLRDERGDGPLTRGGLAADALVLEPDSERLLLPP